MPLKVLMLEDSTEDAELIKRTLEKEGISFSIVLVDTEAEFISGLKEFDPDIVLSDHSLPQFNSQAALKICNDLRPEIPFILVTGAVSEEFAVKVLKQGADDYILKSNLARLGSSMLLALKQKKTMQEKLLAEKTLQHQNLELLKVKNDLDNFIYSLSHDLKGPLSSLSGLVNLAVMEIDDRKAVEGYLEKLKSCLNGLNHNICEIQTYFSNTNLNVTAEKINIRQLVDQCFEKLEHLEGYDAIEKKINIYEEKEMYSDIYRINVIFNNLIINAIKYRDIIKKNKFIEIDILVNDSIQIKVIDNGVGIPKNLHEKVFYRHFRANQTSSGTGMGLYLVKEAIKKLGGTIHLDSIHGEGTQFTIEIPNKSI